MESDELLMKKFREGTDLAFDEIEARYRKIVWSMCRRILVDPAEAEDATQHAFVKLWLTRESYTTDRPFWPWLRVIAFKTCLDHLRVLGRLREMPFEIATEEKDSSVPPLAADLSMAAPDRLVQFSELRAAFDACWVLLAPHQRALLHCIDWSDWKTSLVETSELLGMKPPAIRTATIRYTRVLLQCLRIRGFSPSPSDLLIILEQNTLGKKDRTNVE
jgi:RNA polymerase sigma-70 factor (ECF subfamily)